MAEKCDFIRGWSKERLFELADLTSKVVLDAGAGSGRLTFAAAEKAAQIYACEPVATLREFMREKIALGIDKN
jgi:predicted RNA methylase